MSLFSDLMFQLASGPEHDEIVKWIRDCLGTVANRGDGFPTASQFSGDPTTKAVALGMLCEMSRPVLSDAQKVALLHALAQHLLLNRHKVHPINRVEGFAATNPKSLNRGLDVNSTHADRVSRVMLADDVWIYHVKPGSSTDLSDDVCSPEAVRVLLLEISRRKITSSLGMLRTKLDMFWFVPSAELQLRLDRCRQPKADTARDALGFVDCKETVLLELSFPSTILGIAKLPTYPDAGPRPNFLPRLGGDGWGRTARLTSFGACLPEAIHPPLEWPSDSETHSLGMISHSSSSRKPQWEKYCFRLQSMLDEMTPGFWANSIRVVYP